MRKMSLAAALIVFTIFSTFGMAYASFTTYSLNVTFTDGGTAIGTFTVDENHPYTIMQQADIIVHDNFLAYPIWGSTPTISGVQVSQGLNGLPEYLDLYGYGYLGGNSGIVQGPNGNSYYLGLDMTFGVESNEAGVMTGLNLAPVYGNTCGMSWTLEPSMAQEGIYLANIETGSIQAIAPVPLPGAILLFAPGLMGLAAIRRRFKK